MKRFLWVLSGIISAVLISFCASGYANASEGSLLPTSVDFAIKQGISDYSTSFGVGSANISFKFNTVSGSPRVSDLFLYNDNFNLIDVGDYISISYTILIQRSAQTNLDFLQLSTPVSGCIGPRIGSALQYISCDITSIDSSVYQNTENSFYSYVSSYHIQAKFRLAEKLTRAIPTSGIVVNGQTPYYIVGDSIDVAIYFDPVSWSSSSSDSATVDSINNSANQAHQDSQAQLDFDKQQAQKEEEQRQQDKQKAQDSSVNSQSSAEDSQSDIDNATGNFFTIINGVKDSILQGSNKGNCNISGDFGVFNVGSINLCTGGSKVTPITNIVGTVMLAFFTFNASITVIKQFYELYMEYMR